MTRRSKLAVGIRMSGVHVEHTADHLLIALRILYYFNKIIADKGMRRTLYRDEVVLGKVLSDC